MHESKDLTSFSSVSRAQSINARAFFSTVKPTVIDVDIYVNSIGPVSSINMVRHYYFSDLTDSFLADVLVAGFCARWLEQMHSSRSTLGLGIACWQFECW